MNEVLQTNGEKLRLRVVCPPLAQCYSSRVGGRMISTKRPLAEKWNFTTLLVQGVARRIGNELSSEKLVLPFLYTALGGPVLFSGVFAPVVVVARLLAQLLGARLVELTSQTRFYLALSTALIAVTLVSVAVLSPVAPVAWLPMIFILASTVMGISSGFGALTFQDMIGRVLNAQPRTNLLFAIGGLSGAGVIVTTIVSQWLAGTAAAETAGRDHTLLIWVGAGMLLLSSLGALAVREDRRALSPFATDKGYAASLVDSVRIVWRLPWFRRFTVERMLLMSVEMVTPFFAVHAATFHPATVPSLSLFVIAVSAGMIGGGLAWPFVSRRSIQLVLSASAVMASLAALLALANHLVVAIQAPLTHAAMLFLLGFATQGSLDGSTAYVVGSSSDGERPYCIAVSNLAAAITGVGLAFAAGLVAEQRGVIVAILIMGVLNLAAAYVAMTLPTVRPLT